MGEPYSRERSRTGAGGAQSGTAARRCRNCRYDNASVPDVSADNAAVTIGARDLDDVVIGRYRLRQIIGRGGSSVVYRAINDHQASLPPVVAVKVALDERAADPEFRRQFHEQSRVSA